MVFSDNVGGIYGIWTGRTGVGVGGWKSVSSTFDLVTKRLLWDWSDP